MSKIMSLKCYFTISFLLASCEALRLDTTAVDQPYPPTDISFNTATTRRWSLAHEQAIASTAHVYVINLDQRKDKCKCMQNTLSNTSFPLFRFSAANATNWRQLCPDLKSIAHPRQAALYCTNYLIWEKMNKIKDEKGTPPYFIVFEDDIALRDTAWEYQVMQVLSSNCTNLDWDFIRVDTNFNNAGGKEEKCGMGNRITMARGGAAGTHMVIYRTKNVPNLLQLKTARKFDDKFGNRLFWSPGIVSQMTKKLGPQGQPASGCSKTATKSDMGFVRNMARTLPCD